MSVIQTVLVSATCGKTLIVFSWKIGTILCALLLRAGSLASEELPRVHLLGTGGTISGGSSGSLSASEISKLVPGLDGVAELSVEDFVSIGSSRMTPDLQFRLARRVRALFRERPELSGIVITHGTDSLEETAFLLDLLGVAEKPVVFAAAQRPPRRSDTDGPRNLLNAIRIAAAESMGGLGVLVTMNDEIHGARDVRKTHSVALNAFASPWVGPLGQVDGDRIYLFHRPARRLELDVDRVEPLVTLIRLYAGSDGSQVKAAVRSGQRAVVIEVFGRGNVPPKVLDAVREARKLDVIVVFTTRTGGGRVELGTESKRIGVLSGEDLDGLKARLVLVAAMGTTTDLDELASYYRQLSGELDTAVGN
jgi:L-asparaginase